MIPTLIIDSTNCKTELCMLGKAYGTDKSPYNTIGHRHPYTAVYNMLFAVYKNKNINFAEIGVAGGSSVVMWNAFFEKANLFFYDRDQSFLDNAKQYVSIKRNIFSLMDVRDVKCMIENFKSIENGLDILVDDSSHNVDDQNLIIHAALPYIKSGGMIIIEDVNRNDSEDLYFKILEDIHHEFSFISFILTEHNDRFSPGYNNDKLLLLVKK